MIEQYCGCKGPSSKWASNDGPGVAYTAAYAGSGLTSDSRGYQTNYGSRPKDLASTVHYTRFHPNKKPTGARGPVKLPVKVQERSHQSNDWQETPYGLQRLGNEYETNPYLVYLGDLATPLRPILNYQGQPLAVQSPEQSYREVYDDKRSPGRFGYGAHQVMVLQPEKDSHVLTYQHPKKNTWEGIL
jgi:hypothetical protein